MTALAGAVSLEIAAGAQAPGGAAQARESAQPLPPPPVAEDQVPPPGRPATQPLKPVPVTQLEERLPQPTDEQRFSLSFSEPINIREMLLLVVRDTGMSVILDPDVDGTFVGELKNVTLRQALDLSLGPLSLQSSIEDNVIHVYRRVTETRIFHVNYVATRRSGSRSVSATSGANGGMGIWGGGFGVGGGFVGGGWGSNYGNTGMGTGGSQSSVSASDSTDFFQELQAGVQMLLSGEGRMNVDRKAGLVQVTDYPDRLDRIGLYLEAVETRVNRQVQIQAKVIEVELNESFSAGINWAAVFKSAGNSIALTQELIPTQLPGAFTLGVRIRDFTGMLKAFGSQGRVNVLSSPHVTAMNNEPAVMRVGTQDVFFVTTSQVDATTGRILQTSVVPQSITEGVVLSVTPQVSADGIINLSINPSITDRTGQATSRLGDTVPIISVRETDTLVRVREGETVVIAGLMQDRSIRDSTKVPVLGDVPIIGNLFRNSEKAKRKTDLIILLTPTVMTPDVVASEAVRMQERVYEEQKAPLPPASKKK